VDFDILDVTKGVSSYSSGVGGKKKVGVPTLKQCRAHAVDGAVMGVLDVGGRPGWNSPRGRY